MSLSFSLPPRARLLAALVIRETTARFGRSWGGYLWALAEPLGGIVLLTVAFGFLVERPPLGTSFMVFYATGLIPFLMYHAVAQGAMNALVQNRGLLTYPVVTAIDTILARALLDSLTYVVIALLFFPALLLAAGLPVSFAAVPFVTALGMAAALGLSVGLANAVIAGFAPAWRQVWSVLSRPLFLVSGVIFSMNSIPPDLALAIWLNPVAHVVAVMRAAFYGADQALFASPAYFWAVVMALFACAGLLLRRHEALLLEG